MTNQIIIFVLPVTILLGVFVFVAAIVFAVVVKTRKDTGQALSLISRIQKLDDETMVNLNRIEAVLKSRVQSGVLLSEDADSKIKEILDDMNKESDELISIISELSSVIPPIYRNRITPRTKEMKRKLALTKIKVDAMRLSLNHEG